MRDRSRLSVCAGLTLLGIGMVPAAASGPVPGDEPVTIGLFLPARGPEAPAAEELLRGARMAVDAINRQGGIGGRTLQLATVASDGIWEGVSQELVRMIYERKVRAVIGAMDGRTAHVAEQVITKARGEAVFVTPWSSEESLTRIGIPWFFQLVPDDRRQGRVLAEEILGFRGGRRTAVWTEEEFDSRSVTGGFLRWMPAGSVRLFAAGSEEAMAGLARRIRDGEIDSVVLAASPARSADLVRRLRRERLPVPLFATLRLATGDFLARVGSAGEEIRFLTPGCDDGVSGLRNRFSEEYRNRFGSPPAPPALFGHDAVMVVADAMRRAGTDDPHDLATALGRSSVQGVTGRIRFDERRGRPLDLALNRVENGGLVSSCGDLGKPIYPEGGL